jgi:hypothetical protein
MENVRASAYVAGAAVSTPGRAESEAARRGRLAELLRAARRAALKTYRKFSHGIRLLNV